VCCVGSVVAVWLGFVHGADEPDSGWAKPLSFGRALLLLLLFIGHWAPPCALSLAPFYCTASSFCVTHS
jgi:hypothetical protein